MWTISRCSMTIPNNLRIGEIELSDSLKAADCACTRARPVLWRRAQPATFLGFVLLSGGLRRLPEENVRRFRNRLRGLRARWRQGSVRREDIERRVGAWIAHAEHANSWRLRRAIFGDGRFDPSPKPDRPPAGVCCAAAPGTTNRGTSVPPIATGTKPATGTTTTASALPARSAAGAGVLTGDAGRARERPGTVMMSESPASPLPRARGGGTSGRLASRRAAAAKENNEIQMESENQPSLRRIPPIDDQLRSRHVGGPRRTPDTTPRMQCPPTCPGGPRACRASAVPAFPDRHTCSRSWGCAPAPDGWSCSECCPRHDARPSP